MLSAVAGLPLVLGLAVLVSLVVGKYFNLVLPFLAVVVVTSILYQRHRHRQQGHSDTFEETLVNVSQFLIVTGISGYIIVRIVGLFLPGFD